jgi:hypothetical protein
LDRRLEGGSRAFGAFGCVVVFGCVVFALTLSVAAASRPAGAVIQRGRRQTATAGSSRTSSGGAKRRPRPLLRAAFHCVRTWRLGGEGRKAPRTCPSSPLSAAGRRAGPASGNVPWKRYGPRSAVNRDGCREAIGSTIATDDATRRTSPTSTGIHGHRFDLAVGGRCPLGIAVAQDCPWPRLWRYL